MRHDPPALTLQIGRPARLGGHPVRLPVEGARAFVAAEALAALLSFEDPSPDEVAAVASGPVEAAAFTETGTAALPLRLGLPGRPGFVETVAPVERETDTVPPRLLVALCDAEDHVVRALRACTLPDAIATALCAGLRRQRRAFRCPEAARLATLRAVGTVPVADLFCRATARAVLPPADRSEETPRRAVG